MACLPAVVHQAAGHVVLPDDPGHLFIPLQAPDIIDQIHTCGNSRLRHLAFVGIQREGHVKTGLYSLDIRHHPLQLLLGRHAVVRSRSGGFPSDIQDIHAFCQHLLHMYKGLVHAVPLSPIGKRVRGHIQYAHHISSVFYVKFPVADPHMILSFPLHSTIESPGSS